MSLTYCDFSSKVKAINEWIQTTFFYTKLHAFLHGTLHRPHLHIVSDGGDGVVEAGPDLFSVQCSVYKSIISRIWLSQAISSQAALSQDAEEKCVSYTTLDR